jgi:hypothetical protein
VSRPTKIHRARESGVAMCGQSSRGVADWMQVTCLLCLRRLPVLDQPFLPPEGAHDLGGGHWSTFVSFREEDHPGAPVPAGLIHWHPKPGTTGRTNRERCGGVIFWWLPEGDQWRSRPRWDLHALDPIHVEPSLLCTPGKGGCGSHGWIRDGKWAAA